MPDVQLRLRAGRLKNDGTAKGTAVSHKQELVPRLAGRYPSVLMSDCGYVKPEVSPIPSPRGANPLPGKCNRPVIHAYRNPGPVDRRLEAGRWILSISSYDELSIADVVLGCWWNSCPAGSKEIVQRRIVEIVTETGPGLRRASECGRDDQVWQKSIGRNPRLRAGYCPS